MKKTLWLAIENNKVTQRWDMLLCYRNGIKRKIGRSYQFRSQALKVCRKIAYDAKWEIRYL